MNLTTRQFLLLNQLREYHPLPLKSAAEHFNVSERTIRYDVSSLCTFFSDNDFLVIDMGEIQIKNTSKLNQYYHDLRNKINYYDYKLSMHERSHLIAFILMFHDNTIFTSQQLANRLSVSRSTISSDMQLVNDILDEMTIAHLTLNGKGICVNETNETGIRTALLALAFKFDFNSLYSQLIEYEIEIDVTKNIIQDILLKSEITSITNISEHEFNQLVFYLMIIASRLVKGKYINDPNEAPVQSNSSLYAKRILEHINELFRLHLSPTVLQAEIIAFLNYLSDFDFMQESSYDPMLKSDLEIQIKISSFVFSVCSELNITDKMELTTLKNLIYHIQDSLYHANSKVNSIIPNPFINELKKNYPDIFKHVKNHIRKIEFFFPHVFTIEEISFIVMHFAVEVEAAKQKKEPLNVLLIGRDSKSENMLTKVKLKNELNINVVDVIPTYKVDNYDLDDINLIISTIPVTTTNHDIININPLLSSLDIKNIKKYITDNDLYHKNDNLHMEMEINRIASYIQKYNSIISSTSATDPDIINLKINILNQEYLLENHSDAVANEWFWSSLDINHVILHKQVGDWRSAIRFAGEILLVNNDIKEEYIQAMVENVEVNGPYIVFFPGVAIAHATPKNNIIRSCVSLVVLENEVEFHHEENDPVKFVIAFGSSNDDYLDLFYHIAQCMANKTLQDFLIKASNSYEVINIIKLFETDLFHSKEILKKRKKTE